MSVAIIEAFEMVNVQHDHTNLVLLTLGTGYLLVHITTLSAVLNSKAIGYSETPAKNTRLCVCSLEILATGE